MSSPDDESLSAERDWCGDDRGLCDMPHLVEGRRFSIKLQEAFDVETDAMTQSVFFVIKLDFFFFNV